MKNNNFKIGGKTAGDTKGNTELFERLNLKNGKQFMGKCQIGIQLKL